MTDSQQVATIYHKLKSGDNCSDIAKFTIQDSDLVGYHISDKIAYIPTLDYLFYPDIDFFTEDNKQQLKSTTLDKAVNKQDLWYDPFPSEITISCYCRDSEDKHENVIFAVKYKLYSWLFRFPTLVKIVCNIQECDKNKCQINNKLWYYDGKDMFTEHNNNNTNLLTIRDVTITVASHQRWSYSELDKLKESDTGGGGWD
jgi:hypothetical protein